MSKHLKDIDMTHFEHMKCALWYSKESGKAMVYFFVHAFFPNFWVTKGSNRLKEINDCITGRK